MSVEALDTLVHTVIAALWTPVLAAFVIGAVCLGRHYTGEHRSPLHADDIGHQPAHARPVTPPWWAQALDAYLTSTRELAAAHALLRGVPPW